MLKVAIIGLGFMGHCHLENYIRLEGEGFPVKLVAICDVDSTKFDGKVVIGNMDVSKSDYDFSKYNLYMDIDEMLEKEELDYLDVTLPTYLHAPVTIKALNKNLNVFCEKPMALSSEDCEAMITASKRNNKHLMIGQCLRFWPEYEYVKDCVDTERFGKPVSGYFFRGGGTPTWSFENWLLQKEKSGGCLFDQHIHDVDTINWLFDKPDSVSTIGKVINKGNGYDIVSTNYLYEDGKVINAQDDWTLNGDYGFEMRYRVNFERGNVVYEKGKIVVNPVGEKAFVPVLSKDNGYYNELKYFIQSIIHKTYVDKACPYSTMETIKIAEAEQTSADSKGAFIKVK